MNAAYLAAIERAFLGHTGRGLMLSATDITLIEQWERAGIPLEVVLAGLAGAFERPRAKPTRVRGLAFARRAVEEAMGVHRACSVGASVVASAALPRGEWPAERLRARLSDAQASLEALDLFERLRRRLEPLPAEASYEDVVAVWLPLLDWAVSEGWARMPAESRAEIERALERLLGEERRRADPSHFEETWEAHRRQLVRTHLGLPSVSALDARA